MDKNKVIIGIVVSAAIIGCLSAVYGNYVVPEIFITKDSQAVSLPIVILLLVAIGLYLYKRKTNPVFTATMLFIISLGLFFFYWSPPVMRHKVRHVSGSVAEMALQIYTGRDELGSFIKNYYHDAIVERKHYMEAMPEYEIPKSTTQDLARTTISSHPPGVVIVYYIGYLLYSVFAPLQAPIYGAVLLITMLRLLLVPATYLAIRFALNNSQVALAATLLMISAPILYLFPGFSDGSVAGLVAVSLFLFLLAMKKKKPWYYFGAGLLAALGAFINFGVLPYIFLLVVVTLLAAQKGASDWLTKIKNIGVLLLPFFIMIGLYTLWGFNYLGAFPKAIQNISQDYSASLPYLPAFVHNTERIFSVLGIALSIIILLNLVRLLAYLPKTALIVLVVASLLIYLLFATDFVPAADLGKVGRFLGWAHTLPLMLALLALFFKSKLNQFTKESVFSPLNLIFLGSLAIIYAPLITGAVRGEIWRTAYFTYPLLFISSVIALKDILKNSILFNLKYFTLPYAIVFILAYRFLYIPSV